MALFGSLIKKIKSFISPRSVSRSRRKKPKIRPGRRPRKSKRTKAQKRPSLRRRMRKPKRKSRLRKTPGTKSKAWGRTQKRKISVRSKRKNISTRVSPAQKPSKTRAVRTAKKTGLKRISPSPCQPSSHKSKYATSKNVPLHPEKIPGAQSEGLLVAEITHFFPKISVCVLKMRGPLSTGEMIRIKGKNTDFLQKVESMQIESINVNKVRKGRLAGLKVKKICREGDRVYKTREKNY